MNKFLAITAVYNVVVLKSMYNLRKIGKLLCVLLIITCSQRVFMIKVKE